MNYFVRAFFEELNNGASILVSTDVQKVFSSFEEAKEYGASLSNDYFHSISKVDDLITICIYANESDNTNKSFIKLWEEHHHYLLCSIAFIGDEVMRTFWESGFSKDHH